MKDGNTLLQLSLEPVDGLFFRDARPFEQASRAQSGLPMPQTLAGAVRSLLLERHGVDFARLGERMQTGASFAEALTELGPEVAAVASVQVRGPWFTLNGEVLMPTPATLKREQKTAKIVRLDPLKGPLPGWRPEVPGMLPLWRRSRETAEAADDFLKLSALHRFLNGGTPKPDELVPTNDLYDFDDRTGIGIDPSRNTAAEGFIYGIRMLVLKSEAGLYAELSGPEAALVPIAAEPGLMRLGGEGRHVAVRTVERPVNWPQIPPAADKGRLVLLTTPAWFNGWKPPALDPVAAAVGNGQPVSGWDLAKGGPKPNRFMVPAGSVYFLPPNAQVPDELVADAEDASVGWGSFLEGNWNYV